MLSYLGLAGDTYTSQKSNIQPFSLRQINTYIVTPESSTVTHAFHNPLYIQSKSTVWGEEELMGVCENKHGKAV